MLHTQPPATVGLHELSVLALKVDVRQMSGSAELIIMGVTAKKNSAAAINFTFHCALLVGQTVPTLSSHFLPQGQDTSAHMVDRNREHE